MAPERAAAPHPRADAALACLAGGGGQRHAGRRFSSDLSVDEAVLVKEIGLEPRGLVTGSSVHHIGFQPQWWSTSEEMSELTAVMYRARAEAMADMDAHAQRIGGDGVIGLRLDVRIHRSEHAIAEFVAMGTAVAADAGARNGPHARILRGAGGGRHRVWTSDLSGQDLYLLVRSGYAPAALVFGACVYHVGQRGWAQRASQATSNVELGNVTAALYEARELAMRRLHHEAALCGGHGVVAMRIEQRSHAWGANVIEFLAIGTAVRQVAAAPGLRPEAVVALDETPPELSAR